MKIYSFGLDQLTINELRTAGYTVTVQTSLPEAAITAGQLLIVTSFQVAVHELGRLREAYPDAALLYVYQHHGVYGYHSVFLTCESHRIYFLPPRFTVSALIGKLKLIMDEEAEERGNVIGLFGSAPGAGCTTAAKLLASRMAAAGQRVILLGLNVYDPGCSRKTAVSLDRLRPRLTGKFLRDEDFTELVQENGYRYLPGNCDVLAAQDFREEEMEYLLVKARDQADVVLCDCGSIPESAAWYVGMQQSAIRLFVTHPRHEYRLQQLMDLTAQLDLKPQDFSLIINRTHLEEAVSAKNLALRFGTDILSEIPYSPGVSELPSPGKKELQQLDETARALLVALGRMPEAKKKGRFA